MTQNFILSYQINYWHPLKLKLRLNINSNKVLPKVNLALTPIGLNASQLIAQFCLLTPFLYDESNFVNVTSEEVDDGNYLETYITKLEWKNLLFAQTQGASDEQENNLTFEWLYSKQRILIFLIFLKFFEKLSSQPLNFVAAKNINSTPNLDPSKSFKSVDGYLNGQMLKYFEMLDNSNFSETRVSKIFDLLRIKLIFSPANNFNFYLKKLTWNQAFLFYNNTFYLYTSKSNLYKFLKCYNYIILNHLDD